MRKLILFTFALGVIAFTPAARASIIFNSPTGVGCTDGNQGPCSSTSLSQSDSSFSYVITAVEDQTSAYDPITGGAPGGMVNDVWYGSFTVNNMGQTSLTCTGTNCTGLGATDLNGAEEPVEGDGSMMTDSVIFNVGGGKSIAVSNLSVQLIGYNSAACVGVTCPATTGPGTQPGDADADNVTVYVVYSTDTPGNDHVFNNVGSAAITSGGLLTFANISGINTGASITEFAIRALDGSFLIGSLTDAPSVPEPAAIGLTGAALAGLAFLRRKK